MSLKGKDIFGIMVDERIGGGSFGQVYKAKQIRSGDICCLKHVRLELLKLYEIWYAISFINKNIYTILFLNYAHLKISDYLSRNENFDVNKYKREWKMLSEVDSPFVIKFFDYYDEDISFYLIMEYAEKGTIGKLIMVFLYI